LTLTSDTVDNTGGLIDVDGAAFLALSATSISKGTVTTQAAGEIDSSGASSIANASIGNAGTIDIESGTLTLTSDTVDNSGGRINVDNTATLALSSTTITDNAASTVSVDAGGLVTFADSSITGGTVSTAAAANPLAAGEIDSSG